MNTQAIIPAWLHPDFAKPATDFPAWLQDFRQQHAANFLKYGLPTKAHERFKYMDLSSLLDHPLSFATPFATTNLLTSIQQQRLQAGANILLVFINGYFQPQLSDSHRLPAGVIACGLKDALTQHAELLKANWPETIDVKKYPFAGLNAASWTDGLFFYLPEQCKLPASLHLLSIVIDREKFIAHPQHIFVLGKNSQLNVVEEHFNSSTLPHLLNMVTHLSVGAGAQLDYVKLQNTSQQTMHLAHTFIQQQQHSEVIYTNFSFGGKLARDDVMVSLKAAHASCTARGFYHLRYDDQYIDHHLDIEHRVPYTASEMLYKGILEKKSRAVFNGRLHVYQQAQKTLAHQANHNLLLAKTAEVYSKPELEIYADDVKCKHGASIGQLDQQALFYLRSRGIEHNEAITMLLQGFAEEVLQLIKHPGVKLRVQEMMQC